jgi:dimethylargininase
VLRGVPDSFASSLSSLDPPPRIDVSVARAQHATYRAALEQGGFATHMLPPDEQYPDSVFVEDTVVVMGRRALITRPGHPERRGEVTAVADALSGLLGVEMADPASRLDGGDVLQVGATVFVGRSSRTDRRGIEAVERFASPMGRTVVPVPVQGVLHLKSAATALDEGTVLVWVRAFERGAFRGLRVVPVEGDDPEAANVVRLPNGSVLVAGGHPGTAALLEREGFEVAVVGVSEFAKADGGLTCLSVRLRDVFVPS